MSDEELEKKMGRNAWALRDILFDEIENLQQGRSTPQRAHAISKLAAQIVAFLSFVFFKLVGILWP